MTRSLVFISRRCFTPALTHSVLFSSPFPPHFALERRLWSKDTGSFQLLLQLRAGGYVRSSMCVRRSGMTGQQAAYGDDETGTNG